MPYLRPNECFIPCLESEPCDQPNCDEYAMYSVRRLTGKFGLRCETHVPGAPFNISGDWLRLPDRYRGPDASTKRVLWEIEQELQNAFKKFPQCVHLPNGTGGSGRKTYETIAKNSCERATREGRLTHAHVFEEETSEVLAAETDEELRKENLQVAAMALKWILDIDSRKAGG